MTMGWRTRWAEHFFKIEPFSSRTQKDETGRRTGGRFWGNIYIPGSNKQKRKKTKKKQKNIWDGLGGVWGVLGVLVLSKNCVCSANIYIFCLFDVYVN